MGVASILIVLIMGASSAATARATVTTEKAPFDGVGFGIDEQVNYLCGVGTKVLDFPSFNTTNGKTVSGANATATSCQYPPGPKPLTQQEVILVAAFQSVNITGLSGLTALQVHWKLSFKGNLHVVSGGSGQFAEAIADVEATGGLLNVTSGNEYEFSEATYEYLLNTTTGTNLAIKESKVATTEFLNETLSSKDTYALVTEVIVVVESEVSLSGSSVAYSEIQMYGSGEGSSLTSYSY